MHFIDARCSLMCCSWNIDVHFLKGFHVQKDCYYFWTGTSKIRRPKQEIIAKLDLLSNRFWRIDSTFVYKLASAGKKEGRVVTHGSCQNSQNEGTPETKVPRNAAAAATWKMSKVLLLGKSREEEACSTSSLHQIFALLVRFFSL